VLLCAIPYTGWLVGYFVSARMLWRVPWMLPMGLISIMLLEEFSNWIKEKISTRIQSGERNVFHSWIPVVCMILVAWFSEFVYPYQWLSTKEQLDDYRNRLSSLSELGNYIENHIDRQSRFIAPFELMNYLPGLSSKSKVVLMRNTAWAPYPIDVNEIADVFTNDPSIPIEQRVETLDKYNVHYILSDDSTLKNYYVRNRSLSDVKALDNYWILRFR
jgi:hypothetical protein